MNRWWGSLALLVAVACKPAVTPPSAPAAPPAPVISIDRKVAWILRLEHSRVVADRAAGFDLAALAADSDAGLRRRAVLALGRAGGVEAVDSVLRALADPDEHVRATAAFAAGLLADPRGVAPLTALLGDASAIVRGRAAEALGLANASSAAAAVADAGAACGPLIAPIPPDDESVGANASVDACRLILFALVRLGNFDALARVALDANGQPVSQWWPVAFSLQRSANARAANALNSLVNVPGVYTPAFALRGLAALKDQRALAPAMAFARRPDADVRLRAVAIRALGALGDATAVKPLFQLIADRSTPKNLTLEAVAAIGTIGSPAAFDRLLDLFSHPSPPVRAAAMTSAARLDVDGFLIAISSVERDKEWSVRANLATVLATLPPDRARPGLDDLATDLDVRVQAPVLRGLARVNAPDIDRRLAEALQAPDFALRAAAATLVGERQTPDGATLLAAAYVRGDSDATPAARMAALDALARYSTAAVTDTLTRALADREWPVRLKAAALLRQKGVANAAPLRPAPVRQAAAFFESDRLLRPAFSPQAFIEMASGTIQIELDVIDAPVTTLTFIELARSGFYNGLRIHRLIPNFVLQAGDPRGDGEGGPGYTIRDELSPRPYLRGTVGMALDGPDTGGSQFFIALSPQPHLDGRYTAFGRVVRGLDLLDGVSLGEVIERISIMDGTK